MAKRNARIKASKGSARDAVPYPSEVRKSFTPSDVEQRGLGPAFFAVVIAIIALILLSIFGNNYLTGAYHTPYSPEPAISLRYANLTFYPQNYASFSVPRYCNRYGSCTGPYSGPVAAIRVTITGPSGLVFALGPVSTREAFVVVKNLSRTSLPVGSVIYYNYLNRTWNLYCLHYCPDGRLLRNRDGSVWFQSVYLPMNLSSGSRQWYNSIIFSLGRSTGVYPSGVIASLSEANLRNIPIYPNFTWSNGTWAIDWDNAAPIEFNGVAYDNSYRFNRPTPVSPIYRSPPGSTLFTASPAQVRIQYAYDANLVWCRLYFANGTCVPY